MDLPSLLSKDQKEKKELYWSLIIEPGWVQAGIWSIKEEKVEVEIISPVVPWDEENSEALLEATDAALSSAVQKLPEDVVEPEKTVFGVSASWVTDGQISSQYLEKIKVLCEKLAIVPIGFVILSEAISHFLKFEEGVPLNALILRVNAEILEISLFLLGKQVEGTIVSRSVSIKDDLVEGLSRFKSQEFPSRILLYDGKGGELEDFRQEIMTISWDGFSNFKFLHTPKVEEILPEKKILAVCLAGASELSHITGIKIVDDSGLAAEEISQESDMVNFEEVPVKEVESLGFVVNKDVTGENGLEKETESLPVNEKPVVNISENLPRVEEEKEVKANLITRNLRKITPIFSKLSFKKEKPSIVKEKTNSKKIFIIGLVVLILIFGAGFLFWWQVPKAKVTIYVSPDKLEETTTVLVSSGQNDQTTEEKVLPGEVIVKKESGEKTKSSSGTKVVGEKAKGEIKIFRSGVEVVLPVGMEILGPGNLVFTLDNETTVASGSAATPGTKVASVTAEKIGPEYNLARDSSFGVGNFPRSDIEAKNEAAFSGGSSREISAISEEDQTQLEEDLTAELLSRGEEEIRQSLGEEKYLIVESVKAININKDFSAKVGDEAQSLKLALSLDVEGLSLEKSILIAFANEVLKDKVPSGYVLREDQIDFSFEYLGDKDGLFELNLKLTGNLLPQVKTDEIINQIAGKNPAIAREYLTKISGFSKVKFEINPLLPGRLGIIPKIQKNITIEVEAEK